MKYLILLFMLFIVSSVNATYRPHACQVQEPTPTIEVTPNTVLQPPVAAPDSPPVSTTGAPSSACVMEVDDIDVLDVQTGKPGDSCLDVYWSPSSNGDKVNIMYGEYGREFEHALRDYPNAGGSAQICGLKNGVNYKVTIQATRDRCASEWSNVVDPRP